MRPSIGLTTDYTDDPPDNFVVNRPYVRCLEGVGAVVFIVGPGRPDDAALILDRVDGVVLSGGWDIDPALFGEPRHPLLKRVIRERDDFEIALCLEALRRDVPVLAICRGMQVLNVALGGTLHQDVQAQVPGALDHAASSPRWQTTHEADLLPGSRLRAMLGRETLAVNSRHHQAVKSLGKGLVMSAVSPMDGIVEGIESRTHRFVAGVQWHPEDFYGRSLAFNPLFAELVRVCSEQ